jgi:hypothetical protein
VNVARAFALLLLGACAPAQRGDAATARNLSPSEPVLFAYPLADGNDALRSEALRGQPTIVTFLTTYDLASQAEARFVGGVYRRHAGRVHAAAVVLEPPVNLPLVLAFRDALHLPYPVAMGDAALIAGEGPFGDVHMVPSTVVLDSGGRLIWKHVGLAKEEELERALTGS